MQQISITLFSQLPIRQSIVNDLVAVGKFCQFSKHDLKLHRRVPMVRRVPRHKKPKV